MQTMPLRAAAIFSDDMVLQAGKPVPVWGTAQPGAAVRCTLDGQTAAAEADKSGVWRLTLPPIPHGGPYRMRLPAGQPDLAHIHAGRATWNWSCKTPKTAGPSWPPAKTRSCIFT